MDVVACIQPGLSPGGVLVLARRFHDAMVLDAFGSGSYASKALAKVPTMILACSFFGSCEGHRIETETRC